MKKKIVKVCIFDCLCELIFWILPHFRVFFIYKILKKQINDAQSANFDLNKQKNRVSKDIIGLNKDETCLRLKEERDRKDKINNKILNLSGFLSIIIALFGNNIASLLINKTDNILSNHSFKILYGILLLLLIVYIATILLCGIWSVKTSVSYGTGSVHYLNVRKNEIMLLKKDLYCAEKDGLIRHNINNLLAMCYTNLILIIIIQVIFGLYVYLKI